MLATLVGELLYGVTRFLVGGHSIWRGSQPEARQRIYFANHASHLDTMVVMAALPPRLRATTHPVAAADYWGRGSLRRFIALKVLRATLVERGGSEDPLAPLRATLASGESLVIFPEGTRRNESRPGDFKSGLYWLARDRPELELVPVYLSNLARAFPKGALIPVPIPCVAHFGEPLQVEEGEEKDAFLARAHAAVCALAPQELADE